MVVSNPKGGLWDWMSGQPYLAFMAHIGWACWICLFASHWWGPWWPMLPFMLYATLKEFVFDVLPSPYGEGDTWIDSTVDWFEYLIGSVLAAGLASIIR